MSPIVGVISRMVADIPAGDEDEAAELRSADPAGFDPALGRFLAKVAP